MRDLSAFTGLGYDKGRSVPWQAAWVAVDRILFRPVWMPASCRAWILRAFGAQVGDGVLVRHGVRVLWPWKLTIGEGSWIGEGTWILNLEPVTIGANVCISQEALLCTGSHDRKSRTFEFDNAQVTIMDDSWVGIRATVLRGVTVGAGATVGASALVVRDVEPGEVVVAPAAARATSAR